jgi:quinol monooxygenase YgiN
MSIGILGIGRIGGMFARLFTAPGHEAPIANSRSPETVPSRTAESGANAVYVKDMISNRRLPFHKNNAVRLWEPTFLRALRLVLLVWLVAISAARAQTSDHAIYGVRTIDVAPSATSQGIALLKQYRDATLKQPGNQEVDLLQQVGWPNRFLIYEGWKDRSSYDANDKAAHTVEFCEKLKSNFDAPCDPYDYFVVSVSPSRVASGDHPIYMMLHLDVGGTLPPIFEAGKQVAEAARQGEGNLRYDVVSGVNKPTNYMTVFAAWRNRKAFDDYEMSAYARQFRDTVTLGSPYDDRLYTPIN